MSAASPTTETATAPRTRHQRVASLVLRDGRILDAVTTLGSRFRIEIFLRGDAQNPGQRLYIEDVNVDPGPIDLAAAGDDAASILLRRRRLLRFDGNTVERSHQGRRVPDRLFSTARGPCAVRLREGVPELIPLDAQGALNADVALAGPPPASEQRPALVAYTSDGKAIFGYSDSKRGLHLFRHDGENWHLLTADGFGRFAMNATIHAACPWQDGLVVSVGATTEMEETMFHLPVADELFHIRTDGRIAMIAGELRTSATGLMTPRLTTAALAELRAFRIRHLGSRNDALALVVSRLQGPTVVTCLKADMTLAIEAVHGKAAGFTPDGDVLFERA